MILVFSKDNEKRLRVGDALRAEGKKVTLCNTRGFNPRNDTIECDEVRLVEEDAQVRRCFERFSKLLEAQGRPAIPVVLHENIPDAPKQPSIDEIRSMAFMAQKAAIKNITGKTIQNAIERDTRLAEMEASGHP